MENDKGVIASIINSDEAKHLEYFSDSIGENVIKILEEFGTVLKKVGESIDIIENMDNISSPDSNSSMRDINVKDIVTNSLNSIEPEMQVRTDGRYWNAPPPPPSSSGSLNGLVDKYNELLRNLDMDLEHSHNTTTHNNYEKDNEDSTEINDEQLITEEEFIAMRAEMTSTCSNPNLLMHANLSSTKHTTERLWLSADSFPEKLEGEEVEETPINHFSHQIAQMLPVQKPLNLGQLQGEVDVDDGDDGDGEDEEGDEDADADIDVDDDGFDDGRAETGAFFDEGEVDEEDEEEEEEGDEEDEEADEEWEDDNDLGYVTVTISEREFFEMEEDCARRLAHTEQLRAAVRELGVRDRSSSAPPAVVGSGKAVSVSATALLLPDMGDDFEEDMAEAEAMLGRMNTSEASSAPLVAKKNTMTAGVTALVHQALAGLSLTGAAHPSAQQSRSSHRQAQPSLTTEEKKRSIELLKEARTKDIQGQQRYYGVDGLHSVFNLKIIFEPYKTGFEETKHFKPCKGTIIAGRFRVSEILGQAAFSTALQCEDLEPTENGPQWVCLKVIKNNKDFFDQSLDEIKLLQYINSMGDPDKHNVLKLVDYFYCREHLFIVCELLRENLYDFGKYIRDNDEQPYFTFPRLKSITRQVLEALKFVHSLGLIHCDIKPENIVIKSYSRCEVKLIDFGSSCYVTDHLTSYIQSRSYRAPEVILGLPYDYKIDIWSVGAVLAEMHTGYVLFQNDSVATMLARISGILGPMPTSMIRHGREASKFYTVAGIAYDRAESGDFSLIYPKRTSLQTRLHLAPPGSALSKDEEDFLDLVRWMLEVLPDKRPYASDSLTHEWLRDSHGPYDV